MSFREKAAWVTLTALILVLLMYWFHVPSLVERHPGRWTLLSMFLSLLAYLLIEVIAWIVLRLRFPRDARTPRDEREKLIDLKALRIAYYVLASGALAGIFVTSHLVHDATQALPMVVTLSFVLSQIVKHAARIAYYRRGS
jgi:hypothetical protein